MVPGSSCGSVWPLASKASWKSQRRYPSGANWGTKCGLPAAVVRVACGWFCVWSLCERYAQRECHEVRAVSQEKSQVRPRRLACSRVLEEK